MIDIDASWSYDSLCGRSDLHTKIFHLFLDSNKFYFYNKVYSSSVDVLLPPGVSENPSPHWLGTMGIYKSLKNHNCLKHYPRSLTRSPKDFGQTVLRGCYHQCPPSHHHGHHHPTPNMPPGFGEFGLWSYLMGTQDRIKVALLFNYLWSEEK